MRESSSESMRTEVYVFGRSEIIKFIFFKGNGSVQNTYINFANLWFSNLGKWLRNCYALPFLNLIFISSLIFVSISRYLSTLLISLNKPLIHWFSQVYFFRFNFINFYFYYLFPYPYIGFNFFSLFLVSWSRNWVTD